LRPRYCGAPNAYWSPSYPGLNERSKGHAQSVISTDDLCINLDTKMVEINGARVHLTGKEYQMLELLALRKGTTLNKEMFLSHL
jgi:two-component system cell cycle response regulator CtrA